MNYEENKIDWKKWDIVIHDADKKAEHMLMKVIAILDKDKLIETEYCDLNNKMFPAQQYLNDKKCLHDPKRFDIQIPNNKNKGIKHEG